MLAVSPLSGMSQTYKEKSPYVDSGVCATQASTYLQYIKIPAILHFHIAGASPFQPGHVNTLTVQVLLHTLNKQVLEALWRTHYMLCQLKYTSEPLLALWIKTTF